MNDELADLDFDIPCSIPTHDTDKQLHDERGAKVLITSVCDSCNTERSTNVCRRFWNFTETITRVWGTWPCHDCGIGDIDLEHWDL